MSLRVHHCKDCEHYSNLENVVESCGKEHKMSFAQFEDYFIDEVVECPYFKAKELKEDTDGNNK